MVPFFTTSKDKLEFDKESYVLISKIRKQLQDNDFNKGFMGSSKNASDSMMAFVGVNLIIAFMLNGILQYLVMFLYSL